MSRLETATRGAGAASLRLWPRRRIQAGRAPAIVAFRARTREDYHALRWRLGRAADEAGHDRGRARRGLLLHSAGAWSLAAAPEAAARQAGRPERLVLTLTRAAARWALSTPQPKLDPSIQEALDRLDELIEAFEMDPDPGIQEMAEELIQSVDTIHRPGLTRLAELLAEEDGPLRQRALAEPALRLLFELYDLLPSGGPSFIPLDEITVSRPGGEA